jgi:transposase
MTDRSRTYISSVMAAKTNGASPDKRRKYDEAFKAEALRLAGESRSTQAAMRQLGISPKLLYRWQQAQLVAEVGSEEVARPVSACPTGPSETGRARAGYLK